MARVKVCSVCKTRNDVQEIFCTNDGVSLADVTAVEEEEIDRGVAPGTVLESRTAPSKFALEFRWGRTEVVSRLGIGRDADFSVISGVLNEFVSRRHAEVFVDGDFLFVRHVGGTNPTYLNGQLIQSGDAIRLKDGDSVGFSKHETATVRVGGAR